MNDIEIAFEALRRWREATLVNLVEVPLPARWADLADDRDREEWTRAVRSIEEGRALRERVLNRLRVRAYRRKR